MVAKGHFFYGERKIPMELGYMLAKGKIQDLGLNLLSVLSDGGETLQRILLDDETMLELWYYYVYEETHDDWDTALGVLDETQNGLEGFKEEFYNLVVNFSPSPARKALREMWVQVKDTLHNSRKVKSLLSSSASPEDSEGSVPTDTLSES